MLKVVVISPFSPAGTSSFWVCAAVQPQEVLTDLNFTGLSPVFWYLKWPIACLSVAVGCNSIAVWSHFNPARAVRQRTIDNVKAKMCVFMFLNRSA